MKVLSLYCGAGGMDEGLKQAGLKTTLAIDCEKDCIKTIKLNHDCETLCCKIEDIESFDDYDVIVGGPPCPEFSNGNPKRNYDAKQINLFWEIVDKIKPKFWLMENVMNVIRVCERQPNYLLDCSFFGVPQSRVRRFYTNIRKPQKQKGKQTSLDSVLPFNGYTSNSGFGNCNQYLISRKTSEPTKTIQVAVSLRLTDKPVYSKKYHNLPQDYKVIHVFTNEELKLIQGFPKDYQFFGNKQSIKRQIANAVPPPIIKAIFEQILIPQPLIRSEK